MTAKTVKKREPTMMRRSIFCNFKKKTFQIPRLASGWLREHITASANTTAPAGFPRGLAIGREMVFLTA